MPNPKYRSLQRRNVRRAMSAGRPLMLDLCCGLGGWALPFIENGWDVIGIDTEERPNYPGHFIQADVRRLPLSPSLRPQLILASPPCTNYSTARPGALRPGMSDVDLAIWNAAKSAAAHYHCPLVIENVKGAQDFHGQANAIYGAQYLWGDVPALLPTPRRQDRKGNIPGSRHNAPLLKARVPYQLGAWLASIYRPAIKDSANGTPKR